jgi:hypothetical protein
VSGILGVKISAIAGIAFFLAGLAISGSIALELLG